MSERMRSKISTDSIAWIGQADSDRVHLGVRNSINMIDSNNSNIIDLASLSTSNSNGYGGDTFGLSFPHRRPRQFSIGSTGSW